MNSPPTTSEPGASAEETRWFVQEVHAYDSSLKSYLRSSFPAIRDVEDIAQQSYLKVLRQRATEPIRSARAMLFKVAQRLALDFLRRERRSPLESVADLAELQVSDERPTIYETLSDAEKVRLLIAAIDTLPARCREVVVLRKLKLVSQRDTAQLLGISEKGVENQLARGMERCRRFLCARGVKDLFGHGP